MVYQPAEDSYLLEKWVKKLSKGNVADIGTGSGIQAIAAAKNAKKVVAVDIDENAVKSAKKSAEAKGLINIEFRQSDIFENIKEKFDLIIFNPPYLPEDALDKSIITTGGKQGYELIARFLKEAKKHLGNSGNILTVFSSLTDEQRVIEISRELGYNARKLESIHVAFEDLFIYLFNL